MPWVQDAEHGTFRWVIKILALSIEGDINSKVVEEISSSVTFCILSGIYLDAVNKKSLH
jgi:hypothetical protein